MFIAVQFLASWAVYVPYLIINGHTSAEVLDMFADKAPLPADAPMMLIAAAAYSVALLALFAWRKWCVVSPAYLRSRQWGVFFWTVFAALGTIIPSLWLQEQLPELPDTMQATFAMLIKSDYGYFILCIFAPIVEEMVFRGAILRAILNIRFPSIFPGRKSGACTTNGHWFAIIISALIFAAVHLNPAQMPHAFIIGLLLGWMYYRTGSILPGILFHWVNNTATFVVARLFPDDTDGWLIDMLGGDHKRMVLSIIFSLFILLPSLYQLNMRMRR